MNCTKKKRLDANGWKIGSTAEFLNLSPKEAFKIEPNLSTSKDRQDLRKLKKLTERN
jgi:hypothetical protein